MCIRDRVGGGRYDELVADLGGPRVPGIGFAIGEDRLIEVLPTSFREKARSTVPVLILPLGSGAVADSLAIGEQARSAAVPAEVDAPRRSLGKALERAAKRGTRWLVLVGEDDLHRGETTLKDLRTGKQTVMGRDYLVERLAELIKEPSR